MSAPTATMPAAPTAGDGTLGVVPGTFQQAMILSRYQLRDYLRSRRFVLMMSIVAVVGGLLTGLIAYFRPAGVIGSATDMYGTLWGTSASGLILFAGIIFGGDAIAGEFQNKTGYFLMGLPIRRATVYAGKYTAAVAAAVVSTAVYLAIIVGNAVYYLGPGAFSDGSALLESFGLAVLYLLALVGFVFLFSSLFKTSLYAVLVVAVLFLFGFSIIQDLVVGLIHIEPWFLLSYVANTSNSVINYPFVGVPAHVSHSPLLGTTYAPGYAEAIEIMVGYLFATALGGLALFEREEFS